MNSTLRVIPSSLASAAAALGSMVVFQRKDMGVLVNFPEAEQLKKALDFRKTKLSKHHLKISEKVIFFVLFNFRSVESIL